MKGRLWPVLWFAKRKPFFLPPDCGPSVYVGSGSNRTQSVWLVIERGFTGELTSGFGSARVWPQLQQVQRDGIYEAGKKSVGKQQGLPTSGNAKLLNQLSCSIYFQKLCSGALLEKACVKFQIFQNRVQGQNSTQICRWSCEPVC